ncbi:MAG: hypothetical protein K2H64_07015 [Desulfovibrio sp.]|nr:hypothetical protein [Desulfovibrio sp.]
MSFSAEFPLTTLEESAKRAAAELQKIGDMDDVREAIASASQPEFN